MLKVGNTSSFIDRGGASTDINEQRCFLSVSALDAFFVGNGATWRAPRSNDPGS